MISKYGKRRLVSCNLISIYSASAFNPGAVIVIHAPRSCSHIIAGSVTGFRERHLKSAGTLPFDMHNLYVTGLSDKEAIFGGELKLEECLRDIAEERRPSYIMVAGGCVAGVIGDDIEAVCKKVEADTGVPILCTEGSGFLNEEDNDPYILTTRLLMEKFNPLKRTEQRDKSVVILGELLINSNKSVYENIRKLFSYFEIEKVLYPLGGMKISDFPLLNRSSLVIAGKGYLNKKRKIYAYTKLFAEMLGIPYNLDELPETPAEVCAWLKTIGNMLEKPELAENAIQKEQSMIQSVLAECRPVLKKKTCVISFIFTYAYVMPERLIELVKATGMLIVGFVLMPEMSDIDKEKYRKALQPYGKPIYTEQEYISREHDEDLVLTVIEKAYFLKQFILTKRHIGAAGICDFWQQLKRFAESGRRVYHEE